MTDPQAEQVRVDSGSGSATRRTYAPPRLIVHGTVQTLTQDTGGADGDSVTGDGA